MFKKSVVAAVAALLAMAGTAAADIVCPDSSYCTVEMNQDYTGTFQNGQDRDYVTIAPDGNSQGETFASNGIIIRVFLKNCQGQPLVGVPAQEIIVHNNNLCICPGGNISDAGTDASGMAQFSGSMKAGGCVTNLDVFADGIFICTLQTAGSRTVKTNSTDSFLASPCFTDAGDLAAFASRIGGCTPVNLGPPVVCSVANNAKYSICFDYNETGAVDAGDLAYFAGVIGSACR